MKATYFVPATLMLAFPIASAYGAEAPCPALTVKGNRLPLPASQHGVDIKPNFEGIQNSLPPDELADKAREIVSIFETGSKHGYGFIGPLDTLSVGISQWNHGTGSLYDTLLAKVTPEMLVLADPAIRADLTNLKNEPSKRKFIMSSWTMATATDPVQSGLRKSILGPLSSWLATPQLVQVQRELTDDDMKWAWRHAQAWRRSMASEKPVSAPLLANFYDLKVYNGVDLAGLWAAHVVAYRQSHPSPADVLSDIDGWINSCQAVVHPEKAKPHQKLYGVGNVQKSMVLWKKLLTEQPDRFDDDAMDMLVFGYFRAQRSTGANKPNGFPGIYQADVFLRRGTEALGVGVRGNTEIHPYDP